jgi:hypothetical protein
MACPWLGTQSVNRIFSHTPIPRSYYYIAYLACILPIAIIRLVGLKEANVPEAVWIFGMFFLFLLGTSPNFEHFTG